MGTSSFLRRLSYAFFIATHTFLFPYVLLYHSTEQGQTLPNQFDADGVLVETLVPPLLQYFHAYLLPYLKCINVVFGVYFALFCVVSSCSFSFLYATLKAIIQMYFSLLGIFILYGVNVLQVERMLLGCAYFTWVLVLLHLWMKVPLKEWIRLYIYRADLTTSEAALVTQVYGAIVGAWLSSMVIPLDWGKAWQLWPIPTIYGTSLGLFVAPFLIVIHPRFLCGDPEARIKLD